MQTVMDIRFAFERDMVRKLGRKAFKQQPMPDIECVWCGEIFSRQIGTVGASARPSNAITCSTECSRLNKNRKQREWHRKHGATRNSKRRAQRANHEKM